jgi:lipoate-protein ligase A
LHEHELTYALIIGLDHPMVAHRSVVHSYRMISMALQAGLARLHIPTEFEPEHAPHHRAAHKVSAACFDQPATYEVTVRGRKLIGSAQARQHDALLQHGSLLVHADAARWTQVLRLPPTLTPDALAQRMIGLDEVLGTVPPFDTLVDALVAGFEATCGVTLVPGTLTAEETQHAAELVTDHFGNAAWTERR